MITLITDKEMTDLWIKFTEVKDRTLRHTIQIQELQKQIKT